MNDDLDEAIARNRRGQLVGLAFLAAVILIAVVVGSGAFSGDDPAKDASVVQGVKGTKETTALLRGIPQNGMVLGDPDAPVTVVEFVDVKCPNCKSFVLKDGPRIVRDLVRTGKANLEMRMLAGLGPDSPLGRTAVFGASAQGRAWNLAELLFYNQKSEGLKWVTPALLQKIGGVAPELRGTPILTAPTPATTRLSSESEALKVQLGVKGTPTVFVRRRGTTAPGDYRKVDLNGTGSRAGKVIDAVSDLAG
ncbi:thioredoxin domain-containing protein [Patulibacter sp. NPDC049589]|uniref:thioredoxin domain-containing protein n=1 Tax=Patulibacter sp. NPDC049589 TaxID=3154731 RepID=UPI0034458BC1